YYVNQGKKNKNKIFSGNGWQVISGKTPILIKPSDNKKYTPKHLKGTTNNDLVIKRGDIKKINLSSSDITIIQNEDEGSFDISQDKDKDKKQALATTIILSMEADTLDLETLIPLIDSQLSKKDIAIEYGFRFMNKDKEQAYN